MSRPRVFLDVQIGSEAAGRLVIELFVDKTPKTCENFRALCVGSHPPLSYKKSPFHRIIEEFMCQGGDITNGDGTGGNSIYDGEFEDENLDWREMDTAGLVCMANRGKGTNNSQFFITLASCNHLNGKHTIFGQLISGQETLKRMENVDVNRDDRPLTDVIITHCGELERKKKSTTKETGKANKAHKYSTSRDEESSDNRSRRYHKRRRSMTPNSEAVSSRSSTPGSRQHRGEQRSPPSDHPPQKKRSRRRSDHSMDENIRGRTRHRAAARDASPIDEEQSQDSSSSRERQHRRSPSPSRAGRRYLGDSPPFRRRRSLPNQYERLQQRGRHNDEYRPREEHNGREERSKYNDGNGGGRGDHWAPHRTGSNGRLGGSGGGGNLDGENAGPVKFKGRGAMKYREPARY